MVGSLIDIELAYLNTSHPDFIGGGQAMRLIAQQMRAATLARDRGPTPPPIQQPADANSHHYADGDPLRRPQQQQQQQQQTDGSRGARRHGSGAQLQLSGNLGPLGDDPSSNFLTTFFGTGRKPEPPPAAPAAGSANGANGAHGAHGAPVARGGAADATEPSPSRERLEQEIIRSLLESYLGIVRKNLQADTRPPLSRGSPRATRHPDGPARGAGLGAQGHHALPRKRRARRDAE